MKDYFFSKIISYLFFILCSMFAIEGGFVEAVAAENKIDFSYENIMPDNQLSDATYFELLVKPGDEQTLVTRLINNSSEKKVIEIEINNGTTSESGIINYGESKEKLVGDIPFLLTNIIDAPKKIELKGNETKDLELKLTIPREPFDGMVLGGGHLKRS